MSRDSAPVPPSEPSGPGRGGPDGPDGLRPTPLLTVLAWAAGGLALGVLVKPVVERFGGVAPLVTLPQGLAFLLLAAILGYVAWVTNRTVRDTVRRLAPHQAVNRLVMAGASTLVAALAGGGYLGYAISWIGDRAEQADDRMIASFVAAGCAVLAVVAGLLLERACRVRGDDS